MIILNILGWLVLGLIAAILFRMESRFSSKEDNKLTVGEWTGLILLGPVSVMFYIATREFWEKRL